MIQLSHLRSRMTSRESGFTLIELLTVIIIIGVLAAIAIPVFSAQRSRAQDSRTVSDVRNIVTAAETYLSDRTKTAADITDRSVLEYASSPNVSWGIKGNSITNGYCIVAFNSSGKDYNSASKLLSYDSTAGGLKGSNGSCGPRTGGDMVAGTARTDAGFTSVATPATSAIASTAVGSSTAVASAPFTVLTVDRGSAYATTTTLSWTAATDPNVTGYKVERSTDGTNYTTLTTTASRTSVTTTDSSAGTGQVYYKVTSMIGANSGTTLTAVALNNPSGSNSRTGSITTYTVPVTGTYQISTYGGKGGDSYNCGAFYFGGSGGVVTARHTLTAGTVLNVVAGSAASGANYATGGGGGSFVYVTGQTDPLQVAGGGGGSGAGSACGGYIAPSANSNAGNGGGGTANGSGGGAGWNANGANGSATGGSTKSSWAGGTRESSNASDLSNGGYGGGGGSAPWNGGGGGGYTGGNANGNNNSGGGGGSNYIASSALTTLSNTSGNSDNGKVFISQVG